MLRTLQRFHIYGQSAFVALLLITVVVIIGNLIGIIGSTKNLMTMLTPELNYRIQENIENDPVHRLPIRRDYCVNYISRGNLELNN